MTERTDSQEHNRHGFSLFRIFGIEIRLDISVIIIFMLIVYSLANGVFSQWHPQWSLPLVWGTAIAAGLAFFVSLLAHELAHSVVSQHYGIPVPRITLFLFGGMAEISREPDRPKVEFLIAIAGPAMSLLIAFLCTNLVGWMTSDVQLVEAISSGDVSAIAQLGPVTTALLWLGTINLVLAIFNMIPGFPMDGGRVFRALIWAVTGDQLKATRWASNGGRYFGWLLMSLGVISLLSGQGMGGLWWILIGWFISSLAAMSYRQQVTENVLRGSRVSDLMRTHFEEIEPGLALGDFVDNYLLRSSQRTWPVVSDGDLQGFITLKNVTDIPQPERAGKSVGDVMQGLDGIEYLEPHIQARDAVKKLLRSDDESLPVIRGGKVVGLIQHGDILKWMTLHR